MGVVLPLFLCVSYLSVSQTFSIYGVVRDMEGHPLAQAYVTLLHKDESTYTDDKGRFAIGDLFGKEELAVYYLGYKTAYFNVDSGTVIPLDIVLNPEVEALSGVFVDGKSHTTKSYAQSLEVETISRQTMITHRSGSLMKTLEYLPGVSTIDIGSGQSKPMIRGLSFNRVVVVENGIKHQGQQWGVDHGLEIDQYSVEEISLVRGPASLVYGSDAIGGVIDVKSSKVPDRHSWMGDITTGFVSNTRGINFSSSIMRRVDNFYAGGRLTLLNYGDYSLPTSNINVYSYVIPLTKNRLRNTAGNEVDYHFDIGYISENFHTELKMGYVSSLTGFFANAHGREPINVNESLHDKSSGDILYPRQKVGHFKLQNQSRWTLENHNIRLNTGYQNNSRQEENIYINHGYMPDTYPSDKLPYPPSLERDFKVRTFSLNAHDIWRFNKHKFTYGIDLEHQNNSIGGWGFIMPSFTNSTVGVFSYDKWKIDERLSLSAGFRYDYGIVNTEAYKDWFPSKTYSGEKYIYRSESLEKYFSNMSWGLGFTLNDDHWAVQTNIGKSFRMPIAKELASNGVNYHYFSYEIGDSNLSAETSYQIDMVLTLKQNAWNVKLTPFVSYFPNYIYLNPTSFYDTNYGAGNQVYKHTQNAVLRFGGEWSAYYKFSSHWKVDVAAEYVYSNQLSGKKTGFSLPFTPPASILFGAHYETLKFLKFGKTYIGLSYKLVADQNRIVPPENITRGYQNIDFSFGSDLNLWKLPVNLNIQVRNLSNAKYFNHTNFYRLIGIPQPGQNFIITIKIPLIYRDAKP